MPSWIDRQQGKAARKAEAERAHKALHGTWLERAKATADFERELVARNQEERAETKRRALLPGTRLLPTICDTELALEAAKADPGPQLLAYPHLLILRERGFTRQVWADVGLASSGVPTYRGDRLTEEGRAWLRSRSGAA